MLPFWSPDSGLIGFFAQGKLKKIRVGLATGRTRRKSCAMRRTATEEPGIGRYDRVRARGGEPLRRLPAAGGSAVPIGAPVLLAFSRYSADGHHFLFQVATDGIPNSLYLGSIDGMPHHRLLDNVSNVAFVPGVAGRSGHLLFVPNRRRF